MNYCVSIYKNLTDISCWVPNFGSRLETKQEVIWQLLKYNSLKFDNYAVVKCEVNLFQFIPAFVDVR